MPRIPRLGSAVLRVLSPEFYSEFIVGVCG